MLTALDIKFKLSQRIKQHFHQMPEELMDIQNMDLSSVKVREAISRALEGSKGITLIMGPGGCGKSLIYKLIAHTVGDALCLAPTGIATVNLSARGWVDGMCPTPVTINRGLGLPPRAYHFTAAIDDVKKTLKKFKERKLGGRPIKLIMVDEISMVSPNMLDLIIAVAGEENIPLLLFGDPMQLRPVKYNSKKENPNEDATQILVKSYADWAFFYSYGWMMLQDTKKCKIILLDSIYRQSDPGFKSLLNRARIGELTPADYELLRTRHTDIAPPDALVLCKTNEEVNRINTRRSGHESLTVRIAPNSAEEKVYLELKSHIAPAYKFERCEKPTKLDELFALAILNCNNEYTGEQQMAKVALLKMEKIKDKIVGRDVFYQSEREKASSLKEDDRGLEDDSSFSPLIALSPFDRIMFTKNFKAIEIKSFLRSKEFGERVKPSVYVANGMMGRYIGFRHNKTPELRAVAGHSCLVALLDDGKIILVPQQEYSVEKLVNYNVYTVVDKAKQFPVKLAYAITLHKSQGLTLDKVHLQLSGQWVDSGMAYLGLSRCKTLEGLTLGDYNETRDFVVDSDSKNFLNKIEEKQKKEA